MPTRLCPRVDRKLAEGAGLSELIGEILPKSRSFLSRVWRYSLMIVVGLPVVRRTKVNVWKRLYQFRDCSIVHSINVNVRLVAKKNLQMGIGRLNQ